VGTSSSAQLSSGVPVTIDRPYGYSIVRIEPA